MYPDSMRASDADRQRVVDALQEQTGVGRLTLDEFAQRSSEAYQATTIGDLRKVLADLPVDVRPLGSAPNLPHRVPTGQADPPARRALTATIAVLLVMGIAAAAVGLVTHMFFFPLPLLFLFFVLMRFGRGPGYHQR